MTDKVPAPADYLMIYRNEADEIIQEEYLVIPYCPYSFSGGEDPAFRCIMSDCAAYDVEHNWLENPGYAEHVCRRMNYKLPIKPIKLEVDE